MHSYRQTPHLQLNKAWTSGVLWPVPSTLVDLPSKLLVFAGLDVLLIAKQLAGGVKKSANGSVGDVGAANKP